MYSTLYRVFFVLLFISFSTGCVKKEFANCSACFGEICSPYAGFDSITITQSTARRALCDKLEIINNDVAFCITTNPNQFEYKCKDNKYEWELRFPLAPK